MTSAAPSPRARLAALLPLLAGCPLAGDKGEREVGGVQLCLGNDAAAEEAFGSVLFDVSGTVVSDLPGEVTPGFPVPCYRTPARALTLLDDDGVTWTLGYTVTAPSADGGEGPDDTPIAAFAEAAPVTLRFRGTHDFGDAFGAVVIDADGPLLAMEDGSWGPGLADGDVPGLTVTQGPRVATEASDCGDIEAFAIHFAGDDAVDVTPYAEAPVTVGGQPLTARAVADWGFVDVSCPDATGAVRWAAWR